MKKRFLINADGIDGFWPPVMNGAFGVNRNIPINHQYFLHFAVKVQITLLQIVANLVGLDFVLVEDSPYGTLACVRQTGKASRLGAFGYEARRSEEHTAELQSQFQLLSRLL